MLRSRQPEVAISATHPRQTSSAFPRWPSAIASAKPMMPLRGVRISWLIFAMKSDFDRFAISARSSAASARARAARSARSLARLRRTSCTVTPSRMAADAMIPIRCRNAERSRSLSAECLHRSSVRSPVAISCVMSRMCASNCRRVSRRPWSSTASRRALRTRGSIALKRSKRSSRMGRHGWMRIADRLSRLISKRLQMTSYLFTKSRFVTAGSPDANLSNANARRSVSRSS